MILSEGFTFNSDTFKLNDCNNTIGFLCNFEKGENYSISRACIIKLIHYLLTEFEDFDSTFKKYEEEVFVDLYDINYSFPILDMCYQRYKYGFFTEKVRTVLAKDKEFVNMTKYLRERGISDDKYGLKYEVVFKDDMIDAEGICFFKNPINEYGRFIVSNLGKIKVYARQDINTLLLSPNGAVIGYKYTNITSDSSSRDKRLSKIKYKNQKEFIDVFIQIFNAVYKIKSNNITTDNSDEIIDLEKIIKINFANNSIKVHLYNYDDIYNIQAKSINIINESIGKLFVKTYIEFLEKKYGKISNTIELYEKIEFKYLPSHLAQIIIQYFEENQNINWKYFKKDFAEYKNNKDILNDSMYIYSGFVDKQEQLIDYIFDVELEKSKIVPRPGMICKLSDGTIASMYNTNCSFVQVENTIENNNRILAKIIDNMDNINLCKYTSLIVSTQPNRNNTYNVVGYVIDSVGERISNYEDLNKLNNKDFVKLAINYFSKFKKEYIKLNNIQIDKDMNVYIDAQREDFKVERIQNYRNYMEFVASELKNMGYNLYFGDLNLNTSKEELVKYFESLDTFCSKHNYYHSSDKQCSICKLTLEHLKPDMVKDLEVIYEDEYAIHYKKSDSEAIKLYKIPNSKLDIAQIENNVDKMILLKLKKQRDIFGQNLFIPLRKVLDASNNDKFIGYIYEYVDLKEEKECINLSSKDNLTNLPRVKSCIRLLSQVNDLYSKGYAFINANIGQVYISKNYAKQVQLINPEFLTNDVSANFLNKEVVLDYVKKIIEEDSTIQLKNVYGITSIDEMIQKIDAYANLLSKYCPLHRYYYEKGKIFCPKCLPDEVNNKINIIYATNIEVDKWKKLNEGGESNIYEYSNNSIAKVFKEEETDEELKKVILSKIFLKRKALNKINAQCKGYKYIIPDAILYDKINYRIIGYTMERADGKPIVTLRDKTEVNKLNLSRDDIIDILITVGEGIEKLHSQNIFIGDLNGRNILFDSKKNVYFLDLDGMGIDDISPMFYTDGYIDPISKKNNCITKKDDWYSYAIQAFYYLTYTHPFNGICSNSKKNLDILAKMEQRTSLLGNHGIEAPAVAEDWGWMPKELLTAFLNIFEKDYRESIVPLLRSYRGDDVQEIIENKSISNKEAKSNIQERIIDESTFMVEEERIDGYNILKIINSMAIVTEYNGVKAVVLRDNNAIIIPEDDNALEIKKIIFSENKSFAAFVYSSHLVVYDLDTNLIVFDSKTDNFANVQFNGNILYYTNMISSFENVIYMCDLEKPKIEAHSIRSSVDGINRALNVVNNSKFMVVKCLDNEDNVYCNDDKYITLSKAKYTDYTILYDDISRKWCILSSKGKILIIKSNGKNDTIVEYKLNDDNIYNTVFTKGKLYIPFDGGLVICNIDSNEKKIIKSKKITFNTKLNINKDGFSIITNSNHMYRYKLRKNA